ncbi:hypothetical protein OG723_44255 (plasmid) [Streptomyces sp. NBC_01278]|uniref:hypothetical protein n=1 Tax=Streptomyces sp. NBC_01278 TaxID=2903809 RepID=UPI002E331BF4|nr:hypothetical protein [Streptomyces sp. NBC_01278]
MPSAQAVNSPAAVTIGERRAKRWNDNQQRAVFYASLGLMLASITSIKWACTIIGFPVYAAWLVAGSFELLVAIIGDAASSTRQRNEDGTTGGYYGSLWAIFAFMLLLAMTANVGHAVFTMGDAFAAGAMPQFLENYQREVMTLGAAFAAAVPLGGTFGFHVSGFLRKYGAGADWVDDSGAKQAGPDAQVHQIRSRRRQATAPASATPRPVVNASILTKAPQGAPLPLAPPVAPPPASVPPPGALTEDEIYERIKEALDRGEEARLQAHGDLNGAEIAKLAGLHPSNGRRMRDRCLSRYLAEASQPVPEWLKKLARAA